MGGKGSGRKATHNDEYHRVMRERQREYTKKHRKTLRLAGREQISVAEARKRLGIKADLKKTHGKKRGKKK